MTDKLIYAVGDIHGRLDLLGRAVDAIQAHRGDRPGEAVFLGDYVDNGPDSPGVVAFLIEAGSAISGAGLAVTCLRGNHEAMMAHACRTGDMEFWLANGGRATLAAYGGVVEGVPAAHLDWMEALPLVTTDAHRIYVHAGLEPGVPLDRQEPQTCLWIRERFLRADRPQDFPDGKHVVHGHTPVWAGKPEAAVPERLPHRTNLDTGAFATGVLTVGVFDAERPGGAIQVLSVQRG